MVTMKKIYIIAVLLIAANITHAGDRYLMKYGSIETKPDVSTAHSLGTVGVVNKYYNDYDVTFTVTDNNMTPIENALIDLGYGPSQTNASGQALFPLVPEGGYNYSVSKTGYITYNGSIFVSGNTSETVTLFPDPAICPEPTNLSASNITQTQADAQWTAGGTETAWNLEYGPQGFSQGSGTLISTTPNNPNTITGLSAATSYDYYVQADCGGSQSSWVGPETFTTLNPGINTYSNPTACSLNFTITDNQCPSVDEFYLDITSAPGNSLGSDVKLSSVKAIITHTYVNDLTFSLVSPNGAEVVLCSNKGGGNDDFGVNDGSCTQYTEFTMEASSDISSGSYPYVGQYLPDGDFASFNDGSSPYGSWTFKICDNAAQDAGAVQYVELVFATFTGVNEIADEQNISIYPNPVNDFFEISSVERISGIKIFSATGKEILYKRIDGFTASVDMTLYPSGLYVIQMSQGNKIINQRIIKE
jgi:subtilisin-like proprotein convertase family protein